MVNRGCWQRGLNLAVKDNFAAHHLVSRPRDGGEEYQRGDANQDPDRIEMTIEHAKFPFLSLIMSPFRGSGNKTG